MERFYKNEWKRRQHERDLETGRVVTCEQLHDICKLIVEGRGPDGSFGDHECIVYELLKTELGL